MQFSEIRGQEKALQMIQRAVQNKHIAHAYLFTGPEGTGKKKAALTLAQYLNCEAPDCEHIQSCEHCSACIQASCGSHPDIILLEPEKSSIKIEQIRDLLGKAALRNYEGTYKVIILNDAHLMTEQAANCLLKTLEEPKGNTIFILITAQPQNLPVTILSRCQQIAFQALPSTMVREILEELHPEKQSQIGLAAILSKGSIQTAESLLANEEISSARQELYSFLLRLPKSSPAQIMHWCEQWDKNRKMVKFLLELGQLWYHDVLLVNTARQWELLLNQDYLADLKMQKIAPEQALKILNQLHTACAQLEANASPRLVLEIALLRIQEASIAS